MSATTFEYRHGPRVPVLVPLDSVTADIEVGDALTLSGATAGYVKEADAVAEAVVGFAMQKVTSGSADGDVSVLVDVSKESVYEAPADAGSVTQALLFTALDVGANARSVDINGTTTADLLVVQCDVDANTIYVKRA